MPLNTEHLQRCIQTLQASLVHLRAASPASIEYEIYRNAVVKGFELTLETAGKLLRRVLKDYVGNPREVDTLVFKDVFRQGAKHGLLDSDAVRRWLAYRDNRNNTAHDYGEAFAEQTLVLLDSFVRDADALEQGLRQHGSLQ